MDNRFRPTRFTMETLKKVEVDAKFTFLTIFDRFLYSISYKDNFITSFTEAHKGRKSGISNPQEETQTLAVICTEWYLVTTTYYDDGSTSSYEELLGTTCTSTGGCLPNEWCEPQPEDPGNGGSGYTEPEYEYAKRRTIMWTVYSTGSGVFVSSFEAVKGKANNLPTKGTFTGVSHIESRITSALSENWHWFQLSSNASASLNTASFSVTGELTLQLTPSETRTGSISTTYEACFP